MTYQESFEKIKAIVNTLDASKVEGHFAYQFNIIGDDDHGIFYVSIADGKIEAQPYDYVDNNATVTGSSSEFVKYFNCEDAKIEVVGDQLDVLTAVIVNANNAKKKAAAKTETATKSTKTTTKKTSTRKACAPKKTAKKKSK